MAPLNILQWNCRGLRSNFPELQQMLTSSEVSAVCLQETKINKDHTIRGFAGYHSFSRGLDGLQGGSSLYIKENTLHREIQLNTPLQAIAVRLTLSTVMTICSIYLPPSEQISIPNLNQLILQLPKPFLLLGDFNGHSPLWGSPEHNPRGKHIEKFITDSDLFLYNDNSPTYIHPATGTPSHLDLSLCDPPLSTHFSWSVLDSLSGSDHFPILLSSNLPETTSHPEHWKFPKANWRIFNEQCDLLLTDDTIHTMDTFQKTLIQIANTTIPKTSTVPRKDKPWFNGICHKALEEREKAYKNLSQTPTPETLAIFRQKKALARKTFREQKRLSWKNYTSKITPQTPTSKIWKMIKKIKGKDSPSGLKHLVRPDGTTAETEAEIANVLAESFASNSSTNNYTDKFKKEKEKIEKTPVNFNTYDEFDYNAPFTDTELATCLQQLGNTSPGPDQIHNQILKHLPEKSLKCLLKILNDQWTNNTFPDTWHIAKIIPIPKTNKDHTNPTNYRPIALTSCVCKVMERLVTSRLNWFLETNNLLSPHQCGFRTKRSTTDQLVRLESLIRESYLNKKHLVAIFFDLEKAFETTWKHGILNNLQNMGLKGHLPKFVKNFLEDRQFQVQVGTSLSDSLEQEEGVPQGSVLSPILFNIQINSITNTLKEHTDCSLYVDDFVICCQGAKPALIERKLNLQLKTLEGWADKNGFKFSPKKTIAVHFHKKRGAQYEPDLRINNQRILFKTEANFLGLTFDQKLNFLPHIKKLKKKCQSAMNILKSISGTEWGAEKSTMLNLYRALIRSKLDYGSIVYGSTCPSYLKILDPIHNQGLRLCLGAFQTSPVESLYVSTGEPSLQDRRDKLTLQYGTKLCSHPENPTFKTVFQQHQNDKFQNTPNQLPPFSIRFQKLVTQAQINTEHIEEDPFPNIPPWLLTHPEVNLDLANFKKETTTNEKYLKEWEILENKYKRHIFLFTDGSKDDTSVGAAVHSKKLGDSCCGLNPKASVYTAECYAIEMALKTIEKSNKTNFAIFSDSLSCLQAIDRSDKDHRITKIREKLHKLSNKKNIILCWIPSHIGIPGNEEADRIAKVGLEIENPTKMKIRHSDFKQHINEFTKHKWQNRWHQLTNNKLFQIQPDINTQNKICQQNRRDQIVLDRIRIGHSHLTHIHLLKGEDPPECTNCDRALSIKHILTECTGFNQERKSIFNSTNLKFILNSEPDKILSFLKKTDIYKQI